MDVTEQQQQTQQERPYTEFSRTRRRFIIGLVSTVGFLGPLAGGIYLPALPVLSGEFHVPYTAIYATVSVFMATSALSPLLWAPLADWKGRRPIYIISMAVYLVSNVLMAVLPANFGALMFLRIVQSFSCTSVLSFGAGTIADVTEPAHRAFAMSVFLVGPSLGPTLGPVLGGIITGQASWRWTFGVLAILVAIVWLIIVVALPETLRSRVGNGALYKGTGPFVVPPFRLTSPLAPEAKLGPASKPSIFKELWRIFRYLPISITSFYTAILFANYFSVAVILPLTLTETYGWSITALGGGYAALGAAIIVGSMLSGRFSDWRRDRTAAKLSDGDVKPEDRLVDQVWGTLVTAAGSVMFGWLVDRQIHAAVVIFATFVVGFGASSIVVVTFSFVTECAPQAAASAMAIEALMRNPAAAVAAALTPPLIATMGIGWYFTAWAIVDLVIVGAGTWSLALYGPKWRESWVAAVASSPPTKEEKSSPTTSISGDV